jgi:hypothetical protein
MSAKRQRRRTARVVEPSSSHTSSPEYADAPFSPRRAFVVQFRITAEALTGRAEHIASGEAALFSDLQELCEFFKRVLNISAEGQKRHRNNWS